MNFTFAHLADCHLGAWRDERMRSLGLASFEEAISRAISQKVDFIIISGDLFNTALPAFDILRDVFRIFRQVKNADIPVYFIAGSHDYSSAGKTMLHLLEEAELAINVLKGEMQEDPTGKQKLTLSFTIDPKTGAKLCGILGRAQALEKTHYQILDREAIEKEEGFKIFLFHTAIAELKPEGVGEEATQLSYLPKQCQYYAGGHVHYRFNQDVENYGRIVYPGPTFPNSFSEIEDLGCGSFVLVSVTDNIIKSEYSYLKLREVKKITVNTTNKTTEQIREELISYATEELSDAIITLRVRGKLDCTLFELQLTEIVELFYDKGAYIVMKNTVGIESADFTPVVTQETDEQIEDKVLSENCTDTIANTSELDLAKSLMQSLYTVKQDGEVSKDFEERILAESNLFTKRNDT